MVGGDSIEIRLLGNLHVRRADGSIVARSEWRTSKTVELLRLLALSAGDPVPVDALLEKLWPDVGEVKGRASLRTAASQIRRTLRTNCVDRQFDALVLTDAWVDVSVFRQVAAEVRAAASAGEHVNVIALAREAEALYVADFNDRHTDATWVVEVRGELAGIRQLMLCDAAASAVQLRWFRDAEDFAQRAVRADPYAERPHRLLMQAYAGLGETEQALRVFEHCRTVLAEELGADPSPQTRAVHLQILGGHVDAPRSDAFFGRDEEREALTAVLRQASTTVGVDLVTLVGPAGSGREALLKRALRELTGVRIVTHTPSRLPSLETLTGLTAEGAPVLVVLPALAEVAPGEVEELLQSLSVLRHEQLALVAPVSGDVASAMSTVPTGAPVTVRSITVGALTEDDLSCLAEGILSGPVSSGLLESLRLESGSLCGRAVEVLRGWTGRGQLVLTSQGLELLPEDFVPGAQALESVARKALSQMESDDIELVPLLAAMHAPVLPEPLTRLLQPERTHDAATVASRLDRLVDVGVLRLGEDGYDFRHPVFRDTAESWVRPTVRSAIHRRIAESGLVGRAQEIHHWSCAGEPRRAAEAARLAAESAHASGDHDRAEHLLRRARRCTEPLAWDPPRRLAALNEVAATAARLGLDALATELISELVALGGATMGPAPEPRLTVDVPHIVPITSHSRPHTAVEEVRVRNEAGWGARIEEYLAASLGNLQGMTLQITLVAEDMQRIS